MKNLKNRILLLLLFTIVTLSVQTAYAEPAKFNYGEIPFGKPPDEVLKMVEGTDVDEGFGNAGISDWRNYDGFLDKYFVDGGGIFTRFGLGAYLDETVVKLHRISYKGWENINYIDLFFCLSDAKSTTYSLFMIAKEQKRAGGSYEDVFAIYRKKISSILKINPKIFHTKYQLMDETTYEPAMIGAWTLSNTDIFLLVRQSLFFSNDPLIIYRNKAGWKQYQSISRKAERQRKKELEKENKADF